VLKHEKLGKEDAWDIRVSEDHAQHVLPFAEVMKMWERASERARKAGRADATYLENSDPELLAYQQKVRSSYAKPWPRPWPCGTVWLHWDSRWVTVRQQKLSITGGLYELQLDVAEHGKPPRQATVRCFVSRDLNHAVIVCGGDAPFVSVAFYPHFEARARMPEPELSVNGLSFDSLQPCPATAPVDPVALPGPSPDDSSIALSGRLSPGWLGVAILPVDAVSAARFGLPEGAMIERVGKDSPAAAGKLMRGDIIVKFDGEDVGDDADLLSFIYSRKPGDRAVIEYYRGGKKKTAHVIIGEQPGSESIDFDY